MSNLKHFIPFGIFAPDVPDYQAGPMKKVDNTLPLFGGHRPLRRLLKIGRQVSTDPITGSYAHLSSAVVENIRIIPNLDYSVEEDKWRKNFVTGEDEGWDELGDDIYEAVDEEEVDFTDYVGCPGFDVDPSVTKSNWQWALTEGIDPTSFGDTGHYIRVWYKIQNTLASKSWELEISVGLKTELDDPVGTSVHQFSITGTSDKDWTFATQEISSTKVANWAGSYDELGVRVEGNAEGLKESFVPIADLETSGWEDDDELTEDLWASIDEAGTPTHTDYIQSPTLEIGESVYVSFETGLLEDQGILDGNAELSTAMDFSFWAKASQADMEVEMLIGQPSIEEEDIVEIDNVTEASVSVGSFDETTQVISGPKRDLINFALPFHFVFKVTNNGAAAGSVQISAASIENVLTLSVLVAHIEILIPSDDDKFSGDQVKLFAGTKEKLYEVDTEDGSFDNVTRTVGGDYGQGDPPKPWYFTSWGDWVIATNYVDDVQLLEDDAAPRDFEKLITNVDGDETPRAKFCCVLSGFLMLADVAAASVSGNAGKSYTAWISAVNNPRDFFLADVATQSTFFQIVSTPGQCTGLVGGDYGVFFKRNSIFRMSYVGLPTIIEFDQISANVGTPFPKSIIAFENDVYFWGASGIYKIEEGQPPVNISGMTVEKFLFDSAFESDALKQDSFSDELINDLSVQGAADPHSGLLWWIYRGKGDDDQICNRAIIYSPRENRFTFVPKDASADLQLSLSSLCSRPNVQSDEKSYAQGVVGFTSDGTAVNYAKFVDQFSFLPKWLTRTIPAGSFPFVDPGQEIEIHAIRLVYKQEPKSFFNIVPLNITGIIRAAQDPLMNTTLETRTVDLKNMGKDMWLHCEPVLGEFFEFEVTAPSMQSPYRNLREVHGLQVLYRIAGTG
jgi:hypothetical protein